MHWNIAPNIKHPIPKKKDAFGKGNLVMFCVCISMRTISGVHLAMLDYSSKERKAGQLLEALAE